MGVTFIAEKIYAEIYEEMNKFELLEGRKCDPTYIRCGKLD